MESHALRDRKSQISFVALNLSQSFLLTYSALHFSAMIWQKYPFKKKCRKTIDQKQIKSTTLLQMHSNL